MNTQTGEIVPWDEVEKLDETNRIKFAPIHRDLTVKERYEKQIRLYSPCGCGSGKKFKFCCKTK